MIVKSGRTSGQHRSRPIVPSRRPAGKLVGMNRRPVTVTLLKLLALNAIMLLLWLALRREPRLLMHVIAVFICMIPFVIRVGRTQSKPSDMANGQRGDHSRSVRF